MSVTHRASIASLTLGLVCLPLSLPLMSFRILNLVALSLGTIAFAIGLYGLVRSQQRGEPGAGYAVSGMVVGVFVVTLNLFWLAFAYQQYQQQINDVLRGP